MRKHLIVFSPHHDDAYWQTAGTTRHFQKIGWKVTYITVIGDHYEWGGGKEIYRRKSKEAAKNFGVEHILCEYKSRQISGLNTEMAESFCELVRDLKPDIAITEYPDSCHPDHQGVAVNSLLALTKQSFGCKRKFPEEVWCYQGYNKFPVFDISIDISEWEEDVKKAILYWDEFGIGEKNSLWRTRVDAGLKEAFFIAKANPECITKAFQYFPGKVKAYEVRIPSNLVF